MKKKNLIILFSVFVLSSITILGCVSWITKSVQAVNTFVVPVLAANLDEDFKDNRKSHVTIENTGNTPVYVRATFVVQFKNEQGMILEELPIENIDYSIRIADDTGWFLGEDGFYYYPYPVEENEATAVLIQDCVLLDLPQSNKILSVDILAQTIQSSPVSAVEDAWDVVTGDDLRITKKGENNET